MKTQDLFESWKANGQYAKLFERDIWYIDHNPEKEKVICILHGYPTCSYDYKILLKLLSEYRIIIHDHLGFGLSEKPLNSEYLLEEQADLAIALYKHLGLNKISLFAHDYGTSVATEIIYRDNHSLLDLSITKLILSNGSMLIDMSKLRQIQKMLKSNFLGPIVSRLATRNTFIRNMKNIWSDSSKVDLQEMNVLWEMLVSGNGRRVLSQITKYINQRYTHYDKWIGALKNTSIETLILWAEDDPVAVHAMANKLNEIIPNSIKIIMANTGHYPMIENPKTFAKHLKAFLD